MSLHTVEYLIFLLLVAVIYWRLKRSSDRNVLLLVASYAFYLAFDERFAALLFAFSLCTFHLGNHIKTSNRPSLIYWSSVILSLTTLGVFKYYDFFRENLNTLLPVFGFEIEGQIWSLLLPVGISFYTFQAISYSSEIYRGRLKPASSWVDYCVYLSFFPKLVAGPLVRPANFMRQLQECRKRLTSEQIKSALLLLLLGLFKKIVIADGLASLADVAYRAAANPASTHYYASPLFIQGFYLYAIQIYADFSGYTDIARASAALLGFELPRNFKQPYLAITLTEFWNRWHMSLTQWFREYIFFPLSRFLIKRTNRNHLLLSQSFATLITMTLIGFWHGPAWTFIAWGFWHGIGIIIERVLKIEPHNRWGRIAMGCITFHLTGIGWVLFRAGGFSEAIRFFGGLFRFEQMEWLCLYLPSILIALSLSFFIDLSSIIRSNPVLNTWAKRLRPILIIAALILISTLSLLEHLRGDLIQPFIYGQF